MFVARSKQLGRDNREGRECDGRPDADHPLQHVETVVELRDIHFGREIALPTADGSGERFGLDTVEPCGFKVAGGTERVKGGPVHDTCTFLLRRSMYT